MKKMFAKLMAAAMVVSGLCMGTANAVDYVPFSDVSPDSWYYGAVAMAYDTGYMSGYPDGTFHPNATITRAECAAILNRMKDYDAQIFGIYTYQDVPSTAWYADAVNSVGEIMGGVGVLTSNNDILHPALAMFYPEAACTRIDFCQAIPTTIDMANTGSYDGTIHHFTDNSLMNAYEVETISALYNAGIVSGNPDGSFSPNSTISRAEVAQIISNFVQWNMNQQS